MHDSVRCWRNTDGKVRLHWWSCAELCGTAGSMLPIREGEKHVTSQRTFLADFRPGAPHCSAPGRAGNQESSLVREKTPVPTTVGRSNAVDRAGRRISSHRLRDGRLDPRRRPPKRTIPAPVAHLRRSPPHDTMGGILHRPEACLVHRPAIDPLSGCSAATCVSEATRVASSASFRSGASRKPLEFRGVQ